MGFEYLYLSSSYCCVSHQMMDDGDSTIVHVRLQSDVKSSLRCKVVVSAIDLICGPSLAKVGGCDVLCSVSLAG